MSPRKDRDAIRKGEVLVVTLAFLLYSTLSFLLAIYCGDLLE
jgi:hypothetical protein